MLTGALHDAGLFLQQFEHASTTGRGSYVIDTLSCQQQRKIYDGRGCYGGGQNRIDRGMTGLRANWKAESLERRVFESAAGSC